MGRQELIRQGKVPGENTRTVDGKNSTGCPRLDMFGISVGISGVHVTISNVESSDEVSCPTRGHKIPIANICTDCEEPKCVLDEE